LKTFACTECPYTAARKDRLVIHIRSHTGENPYQCEKCPSTFASGANLITHMRIHNGDKRYKCGECPAAFSDASALATHIRIHNGDKRYKCRECPAAFSAASALATHIRIHNGEKPYKCAECPISFARSGNRDRHMDNHEKSQHWTSVCEYVDDGFELYTAETPETPSNGLLCGQKFKCQARLDYHISYSPTVYGVEKRQSEEQMAVFLKDNGILFDRDRDNTLHFNHCQIDPNPHPKANKARIRPDFYLTDMSVELGCHILIGNDEFQHRRYACDLSRTMDIYNLLTAADKHDIPLIYIRVNPHTYSVAEFYLDPKMQEVFKKFLSVLNDLKNGTYEDLVGLNLIYINYDIVNLLILILRSYQSSILIKVILTRSLLSPSAIASLMSCLMMSCFKVLVLLFVLTVSL
jgi:uncharacterized C2H2 Zn-finger protein